mgnify:CR=1 FL=1
MPALGNARAGCDNRRMIRPVFCRVALAVHELHERLRREIVSAGDARLFVRVTVSDELAVGGLAGCRRSESCDARAQAIRTL